MSVISGMQTAIDGIPNVSAWSLTIEAEAAQAVTTATLLATDWVCGVLDWKGRVVCYGVEPAYLPGDTFLFKGGITSTAGVQGQCYVEAIHIVCNIAANQPFTIVYDLIGNGPISFVDMAITDTTKPVIICPDDVEVRFGDDKLLVTEWELLIKRQGVPYVSTETSGTRRRLVGPLTAFTEMMCLLADTIPCEVNDTDELQLDVDPDHYWQLQWMRLQKMQDLGVDFNKLLQQQSQTYQLTFVHIPTLNDTTGQIVTPGSTTIWPAT